jgi:ribosome-binding factor A
MSRSQSSSKTKGAKSQRQLKVGEEIRHILSQILIRGDLHDPDLDGVSVVLSSVSLSPDFSNARVYFTPLGGINPELVLAGLMRVAPVLQHELSKKLTTRRCPRLRFLPDTSFEIAGRVARLIDENRRNDPEKPDTNPTAKTYPDEN